ncbi:MAG TPA: hypothetical protein VMU94_14420 [Streptosporangiaceae bacterium]|nr:hypothetical protein [Streptosporangiaceae bacterium]
MANFSQQTWTAELLSNDPEYSRAAAGSIQVPTNVARFSRALPSSIAPSV